MDVETARWLTGPEGRAWIGRAAAEADPSSLAAAARLRRDLAPARAAAVLDQVALRRRAVAKLGDWAERVYLTRDGLEMATRRDVARWRAARLQAAGCEGVVDAGCGLGVDALAFLEAGLQVTAYERDPVTAVLAEANLGVEVVCGDVEKMGDVGGVGTVAARSLVPRVAHGGQSPVVFLDPSRRTAAGRSWDVGDLSPSWEVIAGLMAGGAPVVAKLGPGFPRRLIPRGVEAAWLSHGGDLVELCVSTVPLAGPAGEGGNYAVSLPEGLVLGAGRPAPAAGPLGRYLWEPDPAVVRSGALGEVAADLGAWPVAESIAYLTGDGDRTSPWAERFAVERVLDFDDSAVRAWLREAGIGVLEIKVRGLDLDPAAWRRRLRLKGKASATVVCTPTVDGAVVVVVRRA